MPVQITDDGPSPITWTSAISGSPYLEHNQHSEFPALSLRLKLRPGPSLTAYKVQHSCVVKNSRQSGVSELLADLPPVVEICQTVIHTYL